MVARSQSPFQLVSNKQVQYTIPVSNIKALLVLIIARVALQVLHCKKAVCRPLWVDFNFNTVCTLGTPAHIGCFFLVDVDSGVDITTLKQNTYEFSFG